VRDHNRERKTTERRNMEALHFNASNTVLSEKDVGEL